jgi:hypothetical protein
VSFWHRLASTVCKLFTFESSPLKPLGQMNRNLVGGIYRRSFITIAHFVPIRSHLAKRIQRKRDLEIEQQETIIAYGRYVRKISRFKIEQLILLCHQVNYKFHQLLFLHFSFEHVCKRRHKRFVWCICNCSCTLWLNHKFPSFRYVQTQEMYFFLLVIIY